MLDSAAWSVHTLRGCWGGGGGLWGKGIQISFNIIFYDDFLKNVVNNYE